MAELPKARMSEEEYRSLERVSLVKHEYVNGERYAMAGGTPLQAAIAANVSAALRNALRGRKCGVASSDLRVHVASTGLYTYPDATVVCDKIERHAEDDTVILNPTLIVEVLSPSTEAYDRGAKFRHYERIASLREYLLVGADGRSLEHFRRADEGQWVRSVVDVEMGADASMELPTIGARLFLRDIFEGLEIFT